MREATDATSTVASGTRNPGPAAGREATPPVDLLRFDLLRSALYHDMRQAFLQAVHQIMLFVTVLLGSGAIAAFGAAHPLLGQIAGVAVAIISAAQLVWDFGGRARDHAELRRRFYALLAEVSDTADLDDITARMIQTYADEPPLVGCVNDEAHNRAGASIFGDDFIPARPRR